MATDREALFTYDVTAPMKDIACVVEVSRSVDLSIPDSGSRSYLIHPAGYRPPKFLDFGWSRRMIRVGKNEPLTPNTEYYYRLQCAGDATLGSFRTAAGEIWYKNNSVEPEGAAVRSVHIGGVFL